MIKWYTMDQHNYACKQKFCIEWAYGNQPSPHTICHVQGFSEILNELKTWEHSLTLNELFRIFVDNRASKHIIMFVGDNGELVTTIKIVKV